MPGNAHKHAPVLIILCCARRTHVTRGVPWHCFAAAPPPPYVAFHLVVVSKQGPGEVTHLRVLCRGCFQ